MLKVNVNRYIINTFSLCYVFLILILLIIFIKINQTYPLGHKPLFMILLIIIWLTFPASILDIVAGVFVLFGIPVLVQ